MIDNGGKGRGRTRKIEIGHGWVIGAISPVLGCVETGAIFGWEQWYDIFSLSLSLSLSLLFSKTGNNLKVK